MKIKLGDFLPRVEWGWSENKARRCHKLGAHAVELQGGIGVLAVAARNGDATGVKQGLDRIKSAAEELSVGLPEAKAIADKLKNRANLLRKLVEPFGYDETFPKKTRDIFRDQLRSLGDHEFRIEGLSMKACGAKLYGPHVMDKDDPLEPFPKIPPEAMKEAKALKAKREKKSAQELKFRYAKMSRKAQLKRGK